MTVVQVLISETQSEPTRSFNNTYTDRRIENASHIPLPLGQVIVVREKVLHVIDQKKFVRNRDGPLATQLALLLALLPGEFPSMKHRVC
jgi:hypothetical protein